MTAKGLRGDDVFKAIYESSQRPNPGVNAKYKYGDAAIPFVLWDTTDEE